MGVVEEFKKICKEWKTTPPDDIVEQLEGARFTTRPVPQCAMTTGTIVLFVIVREGHVGELTPTSRSCTVPVCRALAAVLPLTELIHQLDLADCLLTDDCLQLIIQVGLTNRYQSTF